MHDDSVEEGGAPGGIIKKVMYINRRAPYGTVYALEGLEVVLIGAAFDQDVSVAFVDDGVYELKKDQDTSDSGMKNFSPAYRALEMYDVEKLYVEKESMQQRGLGAHDLLVPVEVLTSDALTKLIAEQDIIFNF